MNAPPTLEAGMQVTPTVRLVKPLGAGGMGAVWLADHTSLKTRVVVKFMLGELAASASAKSRFSREAEAAAKIKSPHVVSMHDHGMTDAGVPFIVMEYLEGHDLGQELTKRTEETGSAALDPARVLAIISQVAKALSKVHGAGLMHRDIKPDNIFLCASDDDEIFVKLLDFGIAKSHDGTQETTLDGQTKTGQVVGTPFYMSPEQVTAQKTIDVRADLWALGVVTFEALTGQRPFDGPSFGALAVKIATGTPPKPTELNPNLPVAVDAWFARACAREPANRFASAKELAEGLRAAFEGVMSLPPGLSPMSDSGTRSGSSGGMAPTGATSGRGTVVTPSGARLDSGPLSSSDRPSFVLASTAEARPALAKSEAGLALGDSRTPPADRRGPSKVVIASAVVVLAVVAFVAFKLGGAKVDPDDPKRAASTEASVKKAPTATHRAATSTAATVTTPSAKPSAEGLDASAEPTASATAEVDAGKVAPLRPTHTAHGQPRPPPTTPTSTKPTSDPTAKPTAPPSATVDVF